MSDTANSSLTNHASLKEAQDWLRSRINDGEKCPCCTQFAKVYRRKIHAGMARMLIVMYRRAGTDWIYLPDVPQKSRDGTGLQWWHLIEEDKRPREDGGRSGNWRVTNYGALFIERQVTVPTYAKVYDGRCLGHTGPPVSIVDCLGKKFDYEELMRT